MKIKKSISWILALCLLLSCISTIPTSAAEKGTKLTGDTQTDYGLMETADGSTILHCFCWSFNTIKENMKSIAEAGYSAIQTSPINKVYRGDNGGMHLMSDDDTGKWYYHYQPVSYQIGNYQLGTEQEFKDMCEVAHSYGVKVIVDAVLNHTTDSSNVDRSIKGLSDNILDIYHEGYNSADPAYEISDYTDRKELTQKKLPGIPDLRTQNPDLQNLQHEYLQRCIADGADGFRFDTAKHIELPDDDPEFASNFWPTILDNDSEFQYGEVLQGAGSRFEDYAKYMDVTASYYGGTIRTELINGRMKASNVKNFSAKGVTKDKLVAWVESHDNYCNDSSFTEIDNDMVRQGWAVIAAQGLTSLFFNRPANSNIDGNDEWGDNLIGVKGDDNFKDPEVVAVNHFHNAMAGRKTSIKNIDTSNEVLMISRGRGGVVIVNTGITDFSVNTSTSMPNGTYTDEAHNKTFRVSNGTITGTVGAGEIAVVYDKNIQETTPTYYLCGYLNGASYGIDGDANNLGTRQFVNGTYTTTFTQDSYVVVKDDQGTVYMTNGWLGFDTQSANLYDSTQLSGNGNKLFVPANKEVTFTLTNNGNESLTLSYTTPTVDPTEETTSESTTTTESTTAAPTTTAESTTTAVPTTTAQTGKTAILSAPSPYTEGCEVWYAYTWNSMGNKWIELENNTATGLYDNVIFARLNPNPENNVVVPSWDAVWNQTADLTTVDRGTYTITGWGDESTENKLTGAWTNAPTTAPTTAEPTTAEPTSTTSPTVAAVIEYNHYSVEADGSERVIYITKDATIPSGELSEAQLKAIAEENMPSFRDMYYSFSIDFITTEIIGEKTVIHVELKKTAKTYTVHYENGDISEDYTRGFLEYLTLTSDHVTTFLIDGVPVKRGTSLGLYASGNIDVTTDDDEVIGNTSSIILTNSTVDYNYIQFEMLAGATVTQNNFSRMGVAYSKSKRSVADLETAINTYTSGNGIYDKIGVHNSTVNTPNSSGMYQFRFNPYLNVSLADDSTLYFYSFVVTKNDGIIITDDPISVKVSSILS